MSNRTNENTSTKSILQHDHEAHNTTKRKLKWDENKLKITDKQKQQVQLKVNEPNTPYIRYDPITDQVTNWQDIPEVFRLQEEEPIEDFSLEDGDDDEADIPRMGGEGSLEWDQVDQQEELEKQEMARKRHEIFEKKRAQHYYHLGNVMHETFHEK